MPNKSDEKLKILVEQFSNESVIYHGKADKESFIEQLKQWADKRALERVEIDIEKTALAIKDKNLPFFELISKERRDEAFYDLAETIALSKDVLRIKE